MLNRKPKLSQIDVFNEVSQQALANLRLEGIEPSNALFADMQLLDTGQLTPEQFKQRAIARATSKF